MDAPALREPDRPTGKGPIVSKGKSLPAGLTANDRITQAKADSRIGQNQGGMEQTRLRRPMGEHRCTCS